MYPFHQQVQEFFPNFDVNACSADVRRRCDMTLPDNVVGHQQRAFTTYWAIQKCGPMDLGLDFGSSKGLTPYCIHVDLHGTGRPHPFYGGGAYFADIALDCAGTLDLFPRGGFSYIASNHSLEHMPADGDAGIVRLLNRWTDLLKPGGILALVVPDNAYFDVMGSDKDHRHAWSHADFVPRVLNPLLGCADVELIEYDTFKNKFSFNALFKKR